MPILNISSGGTTGSTFPTTGADTLFSTAIYIGTGASGNAVTNGVNLNAGGMVWIKNRGVNGPHYQFDTARGAGNYVNIPDSNAQTTSSTSLTSFDTTGFTVGAAAITNTVSNVYNAYSFKKAAKFFDVVTYTGNTTIVNATQTLSHSLGVTPGFIIIKTYNNSGAAEDCFCYHKNLNASGTSANSYNLKFRPGFADTATLDAGVWGTGPTSTQFTVGGPNINHTGNSYVAYLFAHDPSPTGIIQCGTWTGVTNTAVNVNLGWEPQFIITHAVGSTGNLLTMYDVASGLPGTSTIASTTQARTFDTPSAGNTAATVESAPNTLTTVSTTGFTATRPNADPYIYIAIRIPTDIQTAATYSFNGQSYTGTGNSIDLTTGVKMTDGGMTLSIARNNSTTNKYTLDTHSVGDSSSVNAADQIVDHGGFHQMATKTFGIRSSAVEYPSGQVTMLYFWKRTRKFFDIQSYVGDGTTDRAIPHSLNAVPRMMWIKKRYDPVTGTGIATTVHCQDLGVPNYLVLNSTAASTPSSTIGLPQLADASNFYVNNSNATNASTYCYTAYVFGEVPGISKMSTFSGTGSNLNVDCGFTTGLRFLMAKRTDSAGDWMFWDTLRGSGSITSPGTEVASTTSEQNDLTSADSVDLWGSNGFTFKIATGGSTWIFYAIAS